MAFDFPTSPTVGQQYSPVAGTTYTYNGVGWTLAQGAGAFGAPLAIRTFTASGSYVPTFGTAVAIVECVGGGGGGNGAVGVAANTLQGGGGGSGGYSRRILTAAQIGASQTVTIGAGGAGGAAGANDGVAGSATSFGSLCIANGGAGGISTRNQGGAGGSISGAVGDIVAGGAPGEGGGSMTGSSGYAIGGGGGSSVFGGGGVVSQPAAGASNVGGDATNYGSGGSGPAINQVAANRAGGNGSPGVCIVTEYGPLSSVATSVQIKTITASGTYVPPSGLLAAIVECVGGGAGGSGIAGVTNQGNKGSGGGSGGYSRKIVTSAQIGASQVVTIGSAGNGGAAGNNIGTAGGDTSFGTLCIAKGAAQAVSVASGGPGGSTVGAVGDVVAGGAPGESGETTSLASSSFFPVGAGGGSSALGGGAAPTNQIVGNIANGNAATNYGSGGGGGLAQNTTSNAAGGNGSPGVVIVTEFIAVSAVAAPGFPVQIARVDVSSAVATVDFTSGIDGTYDEYELHFFNVVPSASGSMALRISTDGGATYKAGATDYQSGWRIQCAVVASSGDSGLAGGTHLQMTNAVSGITPLNGSIKFANPALNGVRKFFRFEWATHITTLGYSAGFGSGTYNLDTNPINAIRLLWPGGQNFTTGTFILYGIKK